MAGIGGAWRKAASAVLAIGLVAGLAACSDDPFAREYREGTNKGYVEGDFRVVTIPAAERGEPVVFEGVTDSGKDVSDADYDGDVLVVNFWYAQCPPCRLEAKFLESVYQENEGDGVAFLGVNTYDQAATSLAFSKEHGVTYPSVITINDGSVKLAFAKYAPLQSTPVTLVLDREGRVAARIIGAIDSASILSTIVRETLAESS